jgi:predicted dehydrogenase
LGGNVLKEINLGIVGLGNQGKVSLHNALRLKGVKVLGVADVSKKALKYAQESGIKNVYSNYEDLLKNKQLDAVVISLPNFLHLEGATKAAEAGKDILLEKPLARNAEEGEKILSAVRKNGAKLMMGYDMRFDPILRKIHDEIADGFFGSVQIAEATNVSGGPFSPRSDSVGPVQVPSWWLDRELTGGGALLDLGSHMIDLLIWNFGEVDYIKSHLEYIFRTDLEDVASCVLKFKDGPLAIVKVGWFSKDFMESFQVCGTAKNMLVRIFPKGVIKNAWARVIKRFGLYNSDPYYLELEHFVECLRNDEQPHPSGDEGLQGLQVIQSAYENALYSPKKCK